MPLDRGTATNLLPPPEAFPAKAAFAPSRMLALKLRLAEGRLRSSTLRFWEHPHLHALFPRFLIELHSIMRCSVPLMEAARAKAQEFTPHDPVAAILEPYLMHHVAEERDHADWLLNDMAAMGMDAVAIAAMPPSPQVATLIGGQYAWIFHAHPVALFGYMIQLEGNPPTEQHLEEIRLTTGYPAEAFRCLLEHAEKDPHHLAELNQTLDSMPLTPQQNTLIAMSAFHAVEAMAGLFDHLVDSHRATPAN